MTPTEIETYADRVERCTLVLSDNETFCNLGDCFVRVFDNDADPTTFTKLYLDNTFDLMILANYLHKGKGK